MLPYRHPRCTRGLCCAGLTSRLRHVGPQLISVPGAARGHTRTPAHRRSDVIQVHHTMQIVTGEKGSGGLSASQSLCCVRVLFYGLALLECPPSVNLQLSDFKYVCDLGITCTNAAALMPSRLLADFLPGSGLISRLRFTQRAQPPHCAAEAVILRRKPAPKPTSCPWI